MVLTSYSITFSFPINDSNLAFRLTAEVAQHKSKLYYIVSNFRTDGQKSGTALPDIDITRKNEIWVHVNSGKETVLRHNVGKAIDEFESTN